jgi:4-hydroxy-L-threonine phosphate dehydrogenase PdxA
MSAPAKPTLAITMGDPAGIGPEVIVGAWNDARVHDNARLVAIGHPEVFRRAVRLFGCNVSVAEIESPDELRQVATSVDTIPCIKVTGDDVLDVPAGRVDARAGEAAYQAVQAAASLALSKQVDGIVTAPLSKAALHAARHHYPGHTELLAEICGARDFAMMLYLSSGECGVETGQWGKGSKQPDSTATESEVLRTQYSVPRTETGRSMTTAAGTESAPRVKSDPSSVSRIPHAASPPGLGVVHVTLHQSLRSVFADLTPQSIEAKCRLADGAMRRLGVAEPRIAVCALNPHAGEDGLFGEEERTIIAPAVEAARRPGLNVSGPFPADTLMMRARDGEFDAVVAMYHDQGHIALKLLGMHSAVNITLGLPIVRTSVAHGTAFDRAWQGTASSQGMVAAICTAARLVRTSA